MKLAAFLLGVAALLPASFAQAQAPLQCTVRSVHDGDSMRVQCPGHRRSVPVRMHQIDAPELDQAHGVEARNHLRKLCRTGSTVTIHTQGYDQYDRLLGDVYCRGESVNEAMVASGSAWVYNRYVKDRGLYRLQDRARENKRGLWANRDPEAPWRWRYTQRRND